jgi:hypothetical protein
LHILEAREDCKMGNLYTSPNTIRAIKSRRVRWVGHIAHVGEMRNAYNILVGKPERKRPIRSSMHRWILGKLGGKMWTGFISFRIGISGRLL